MRKKISGIISVILILVLVVTGCSTTGNNTNSSSSANTSTVTADDTATDETDDASDTANATTGSTENSGTSGTATAITTSSEVIIDAEFTAKDLEVGYDETEATYVTLKNSTIEVSGDGATAEKSLLTINKAGTYVISGTLDNGQIIVDADGEKVQIVLKGVIINCSDNAPIYIKNADKVFITLEEKSTNKLTDGSGYIQKDNDNTVDAVIFSTADLTMNGNGTLNITGNYKHGIISKDDLIFTSGTYNINAKKDAINGKDCVKIKDGTYTLSATTGNGIQSKNGEDTTTGYVYIVGGTITITKCMEGIEGTAIVIEGGTIDIMAQDDGLNASSSATANTDQPGDMMGRGGKGGGGAFENDTNCYIYISGGTITMNAAGDGIDSNGSIYISGGTTFVNGPTDNGNAGMDYNGTADITGGTIIVVGSAGMAQAFSDTSTQYSILNNFTNVSDANSEIKLTDASGKVIVSYTPAKQYQSVVISSPELAKGKTYTLTGGNQTAEITLESIVTSNGQSGMGFPTGMGGKMGRGNRPSDQNKPNEGVAPNSDSSN